MELSDANGMQRGPRKGGIADVRKVMRGRGRNMPTAGPLVADTRSSGTGLAQGPRVGGLP